MNNKAELNRHKASKLTVLLAAGPRLRWGGVGVVMAGNGKEGGRKGVRDG